MSIVSSDIIEDSAQKDGRRWIRERHVDHVGLEQIIAYLAAEGFDAAAALAARVAILEANAKTQEIASNVTQVTANGSLAVTMLVYSTGLENFAAGRAAYATATRQDAIMIGDFLSSLTNGQLQTAFGMTAGQVTTLRTNKLTPAAALATSIRVAAGA